MPPKGFLAVRSGKGNSAFRFVMLSGPMKMRWMMARWKRYSSWIQTSRGRDDSARAPRMKIRTGGALTRRPLTSGPPPDNGG